MDYKEFLKEFATAYYDGSTKTIYNCREGSLVWWHEKGHSQQKINVNSQYWLLIGLTFGIMGDESLRQIGLIGVLMYWANILILELDAWIYAFKNYKKRD